MLHERVFRGAMATACLATGLALLLVFVRGPGGVVGRAPDAALVGRVAIGFLTFTVLWGWLWYHAKRLLLARAGFSPDELKLIFASRMNQPFDVASVIAGRSERRIRILDMIGRRGRFVPLGVAGFLYVYARIVDGPRPEFLTWGVQESLLDAMAGLWLHIAAYRSDGFFGRVVFGAQTRVMDGRLGRANCLVITALWSLFRLVMVPLSVVLAAIYPPHTFAALYAFIWLSYLACDASSEICGALIGRQTLRVWGIGDVNKKSIEGTLAGFATSLALCWWFASAHGLPYAWFGLALAISFSNTFLELCSPRGTDDFTMTVGNALLCWAFGAWYY